MLNIKLKARDKAVAAMIMKTECNSVLCPGGVFTIKCYDNNGNIKWQEVEHNIFTNEGLDHILDVVFSDGVQDGTHYVGLKGSGAVDASDTLASPVSWTEVSDYSEGSRQAWIEDGVSSQAITNSGSVASFTIDGTATVAGAFLTNVSTGTVGKLYAVADFANPRDVYAGDILTIQYDLSAADAE